MKTIGYLERYQMRVANGAKTAKNALSILDFTFETRGYGNYRVIYESPTTYKRWSNITNDMPLIDATKNADKPKLKDLEKLRRICKNGGNYGQ
jgi:hypothetical protein